MATDQSSAAYAEENRAIWNDWVAHALGSEHHRDVQRFRETGSSLRSIEREELGDVAGKSLLHLLCNMGSETLSWARLGASVTGVDIADAAFERARALAEESGLTERARFIRADLYTLPDILDERFDIVFMSYGALFWLADLTHWAEIVARYLKPGGICYMVEIHPFGNLFTNEPEEASGLRFRVANTYFHGARPVEERVALHGSAAGAPSEATLRAWSYGMGEVLTALIAAGLRIEYVHELPMLHYRKFSSLVQDADGWWRWPTPENTMPLLFSVKAVR